MGAEEPLALEDAVRLALFGELIDEERPVLESGGALQGQIAQFSAGHEDELTGAVRDPAMLGHVQLYLVDVVHMLADEVRLHFVHEVLIVVILVGDVTDQLCYFNRHLRCV